MTAFYLPETPQYTSYIFISPEGKRKSIVWSREWYLYLMYKVGEGRM